MNQHRQWPNEQPEGLLILQWLLFVSVFAFLLWLPVAENVASEIYRRDPTRITLIISLAFFAAMVHAGFRTFALAKEQKCLDWLIRNARELHFIEGRFYCRQLPIISSPIADYIRDTRLQDQTQENTSPRLDQILAEKINGQHEAGWFITGLLIKLGLLGTVIGFILMLASVADVSSLQLAQMQQMLTKMAVGIGVALNTTLLGLLGSMILGMQYLLLDRSADKLLSQAAHFAQMHCSPRQ